MSGFSYDTVIGLKNKNTGEKIFPTYPKTLCFAQNFVVTQYGAQFGGQNSSYNFPVVEGHPYTGYTVRQLRYGDNPVSSIEIIRQYLKFMTGSDYIPVYRNSEVNDVFIYLGGPNYTAQERVWKFQYVDGYGLLAFKVENFPFALREELPSSASLPKTIVVEGVGDAEYSRIYFNISGEDLSGVTAVSFRAQVEENNKDNYGTFYAETNRGSTIFSNGTGILQTVNLKVDSFESNYASFQLLIDNSQVDVTDLNICRAVITLY